jgi:hypothetical protein
MSALTPLLGAKLTWAPNGLFERGVSTVVSRSAAARIFQQLICGSLPHVRCEALGDAWRDGTEKAVD